MKIKITSQDRELQGKLEKGIVKPFGTSAHIPFSKKHMGKKINVIVSDSDRLSWVLSEQEREKSVLQFKNIVENKHPKMKFYHLGIIKRIRENDFTLNELDIFTGILEEKNPKLAKKINKIYGI